MNRVELDSCIFKIDEAFQVFGKRLPRGAIKPWENFLSGKDFNSVVMAIEEHLATGKTFPKPKDLEIIIKEQNKKNPDIPREYVYKGDCPLTKKSLEDDEKIAMRNQDENDVEAARIADAWKIYHSIIYGTSHFESLYPKKSCMDKETALTIVNKEASRLNMPAAILPEYKIPEYWQ